MCYFALLFWYIGMLSWYKGVEVWFCNSAWYVATDIWQPKQVSLKPYIMQGCRVSTTLGLHQFQNCTDWGYILAKWPPGHRARHAWNAVLVYGSTNPQPLSNVVSAVSV
jgi:hypothetical protein